MFRRKPPSNGHFNKHTNEGFWWEATASFIPDPSPLASLGGKPRAFSSPVQLWQGCCEYFKWVETHPLYATQLIGYKGMGNLVKVPKMRAMTLQGLWLFIRIIRETWVEYKRNRGTAYSLVCETAESVIFTQKFTGAAADLLNQAIIARDLGLKDHHELTGRGGGPIRTQKTIADLSQLDDEELELLAKMVDKTNKKEIMGVSL